MDRKKVIETLKEIYLKYADRRKWYKTMNIISDEEYEQEGKHLRAILKAMQLLRQDNVLEDDFK